MRRWGKGKGGGKRDAQVVCLRGAGAGRGAGEVVPTPDEAGGGGAGVVRGEERVCVGCAFGCLGEKDAV